MDGCDPLQDPDPRQGPNGDEPPRPGLQSEASDRDPWHPAAYAGDARLSAGFCCVKLGRSTASRCAAPSLDSPASPRSRSYTASAPSRHSLNAAECPLWRCEFNWSAQHLLNLLD